MSVPNILKSRRGLDAYLSRVILPTPGLVACWPLDDAPGSTVAREITGRYPGTPQGGVTFGQSGPVVNNEMSRCAGFDGVNDYVQTGAPSPKEGLTVSAWLKTTPNNYNQIASLSGSGSHGVYVQYTAAKPSQPLMFVGESSYRYWNPVDWSDGKFHYICFTLPDSSQSAITFSCCYFDGVLLKTLFTSSSDTQLARTSISLGKSYNYLNGSISLAQIYNRALSPEEIRWHYEAAMKGVL